MGGIDLFFEGIICGIKKKKKKHIFSLPSPLLSRTTAFPSLPLPTDDESSYSSNGMATTLQAVHTSSAAPHIAWTTTRTENRKPKTERCVGGGEGIRKPTTNKGHACDYKKLAMVYSRELEHAENSVRDGLVGSLCHSSGPCRLRIFIQSSRAACAQVHYLGVYIYIIYQYILYRYTRYTK